MKKCLIVLFIISTLFPCLANATYHINFFAVQNRTYENGNQLNRLQFDVVDGNNIAPLLDVLNSVVLTDPTGNIVDLTLPIRFANSWETNSYYDVNTDNFVYLPFYSYGYYSTEFSDQFISGKYHLTFVDKDGELSEKDYIFYKIVDLPIIPSNSYQYYRDQEGNFIWNWQVPDYIDPQIQTSARAWISFYDEQEKYLGELFVSVPTQLGRLFVPNDIFNQVLTMGKTFKLGTRINTNDNNNRAYSTEVPLPNLLPQPTACTATLHPNLLLHIPYLSYGNGTLTLSADFVFDYNPTYPTLLPFKLTNAAVINSPSFSCEASTLYDSFKIHIPDVLFPDGITHLWVDLEYSSALSIDGNFYWVVTNYGAVSN